MITTRAGKKLLDLTLRRELSLPDLEPLINRQGRQLVRSIQIIHWIQDPIVGSRKGLLEPAFRLFHPITGLFIKRVTRFEPFVDLFDRVEFAQTILDRIGEVAILTGQDEKIVLFDLKFKEVLQFVRRDFAIWLDDNQGSRAAKPQLLELWEHLDMLPGKATDRLKNPRQSIDERLIDLGGRDLTGIPLHLPRKILRLLDEETLLFAVQVRPPPTQKLQIRMNPIGQGCWVGTEFAQHNP